jgi:Beta-lactamase
VSYSEIQALNDEQILGSRLARLSSRKGFENTYAGLLLNDTQLTVASGSAHCPIRAGCLAKLLTASLITQAVADGHLHWSDAIDDVLPSKHPSRRKLAGVTVRHLLAHTHGLDASSMERVPRRTDGFIDAEVLCDGLGTRSISSPGALYSYGSAGGWLAGAALESVYRRQYAQLLDQRDLLCPAAPGEDVSAETICPATGEDLRLTGAQWLAFVHLHMRDSAMARRSRAHIVLGEKPIPLPGWHLTERAICLGWKSYGEGWFGHNSNLSQRSAILRVNPPERIAIVIGVEGTGSATVALAGLFGHSFPEFRNLRPPRLLSPDECRAIRYDQYVGTYSQSRTKLVVKLTREDALELSSYDVCANRHCGPSWLRPARGDLFIPEPPQEGDLRFVQFIANQDSDDFEYLWNGSQLWRKE